MRNKQLTETELFRKINVFLLDKDKEELAIVKEKTSLQSDVVIDNSALVRGMINYFHEHPEEIEKIVPFVKETKGFNILGKFNSMMEENKSIDEINEELGIGVELIEKLKNKYYVNE